VKDILTKVNIDIYFNLKVNIDIAMCQCNACN